jgi:thiol-disulfide isomerase/thioredoxin
MHWPWTVLTTLVVYLSFTLGAWGQGRAFDFRRDVEGELSKPNVQLVVVLFTAEWCEPCKKEKPIWKRLKDKYGAQGVRFLVIRYRDEAQQMIRYMWPHKEFWDNDGRLGEAFGIGEQLPAAFVWDWQGRLLQQRSRVKRMGDTLRKTLAQSPRVVVHAVQGTKAQALPALRMQVENELLRVGKFTVLSGNEDRERMAKLRRESHSLERNEKQRCALGRQISANSLLSVSLMNNMLYLRLKNIETGCVLQSSKAEVLQGRDLQGAVSYAVAGLLEALRLPAVDQPGHLKAAAASLTKQAPTTVVSGPLVLTEFSSNPAGAVVLMGDRVLCSPTPCSAELAQGRQLISMQLPNHITEKRPVNIGTQRKVDWVLRANFGLLNVLVADSAATVSIDSGQSRDTPISNLRLSPGKHTVSVVDRCYQASNTPITIRRGEVQTITLSPKAKKTRLRVSAINERGQPVAAAVAVDGKPMGQSPATIEVALCSKSIELTHPRHGAWAGVLTLKSAANQAIRARLVPKRQSPQVQGMTGKQFYNYGRKMVIAGNLDAALEAFEKAVKKSYRKAHYTSASIYAGKGNLVQCVFHAQSYLAAFPSGSFAPAAQKLLNRCSP